MYPRLTDLFNDLLGTHWNFPVQTYGFFIALAFITAGFLLYLELKRKERNGIISAQEKLRWTGKPASVAELFLTSAIMFVIGFKLGGILTDYSEFTSHPQKYIASGQGNYLAGFVLSLAAGGWVYYDKRRKRKDPPVQIRERVHPWQLTGNIILIAALFGLAGAKLFDVVEHLGEFFRDPVGVLFSFSGLAFYGGLITAAFAVAIYAEKNRIPWPAIGDAVAPSLMIAYGIGRIGCQLAGDGCWGIVNTSPMPAWLSFLPDWTWSFNYPHNVINEGMLIPSCGGDHCHVLDQPVFPTPLYETTIALIFFTVLWILRKRVMVPGLLFSIYLMMNGTARFFVEKIRINKRYDFLGLEVTQAELIATGLFLTGLAFMIFFIYRYKNQKTRLKDGP